MKTRETTPGKTYSVHTMNGCTIIEPDGWQKTIEAPDGYFDAHFGSVVIEGDDEASIKQLFKLAPQQRLALLGVLGGNAFDWFKALKAELTAMLDGSKFELAWLAGEKKLVVHTDRVDDDLLERVRATAEAYMPAGVELVQYNHNMEISWREINKYAHCTTRAELKAVNPKWQKDLTSEGEWIYPLDSYQGGENWLFGTEVLDGADSKSYVKKIKLYAPKVVNANYLLQNYANLTEIDAYLPNAEKANDFARQGCVRKISGYFPKLKSAIWFLDNEKNVPVNEVDADFPALENGRLFLEKTRLIKSSVLRILNSIPAYTSGSHLLTIGIHVDHQDDEEVLAAIANAEAKGWTMTVQWNGTPTSTASTMSFGSLIYAKVGELERPDGTTEQYLDWGHYVTDWEARGYEQFRSLASAYRYFGLPMPEPLTNN